MRLGTWLAIAVGGAGGAALRFAFARAGAAWSRAVPAGTLLANTVASLVVGLLAGAGSHARVPALATALLVTGIAGGLSTFSTFAYETLIALQEAGGGPSLLNIGLNVAAGLAAVGAGVWLGRAL